MRFVVDTNVPIVANGRTDGDGRVPSVLCRLAAIEFIERILGRGRLVVDMEGCIQNEYSRHLNPRGQPGVGDRFYQTILNSSPSKIERINIERDLNGAYLDFPSDPALNNFDLSDRKFAALAKKESIPVVNAIDSDWIHALEALNRNGITVDFICGNRMDEWFNN